MARGVREGILRICRQRSNHRLTVSSRAARMRAFLIPTGCPPQVDLLTVGRHSTWTCHRSVPSMGDDVALRPRLRDLARFRRPHWTFFRIAFAAISPQFDRGLL